MLTKLWGRMGWKASGVYWLTVGWVTRDALGVDCLSGAILW